MSFSAHPARGCVLSQTMAAQVPAGSASFLHGKVPVSPHPRSSPVRGSRKSSPPHHPRRALACRTCGRRSPRRHSREVF